MPLAPVIIAMLVAWYLYQGRRRAGLKLRHFTPDEFGPYWPMMDQQLLVMIDEFRQRLGYRVDISPAPGAIGRPVIGQEANPEEQNSSTWHNYFKHGAVMAIDLMPVPPAGATPYERERWLKIAREVGFTGIGIYPDWKPRPGIHVDVRTDRQPGAPALWAGVRDPQTGKQIYTGIEQGLV